MGAHSRRTTSAGGCQILATCRPRNTGKRWSCLRHERQLPESKFGIWKRNMHQLPSLQRHLLFTCAFECVVLFNTHSSESFPGSLKDYDFWAATNQLKKSHDEIYSTSGNFSPTQVLQKVYEKVELKVYFHEKMFNSHSFFRIHLTMRFYRFPFFCNEINLFFNFIVHEVLSCLQNLSRVPALKSWSPSHLTQPVTYVPAAYVCCRHISFIWMCKGK